MMFHSSIASVLYVAYLCMYVNLRILPRTIEIWKIWYASYVEFRSICACMHMYILWLYISSTRVVGNASDCLCKVSTTRQDDGCAARDSSQLRSSSSWCSRFGVLRPTILHVSAINCTCFSVFSASCALTPSPCKNSLIFCCSSRITEARASTRRNSQCHALLIPLSWAGMRVSQRDVGLHRTMLPVIP